ncbi:Gfo/Idh/MocA family oxidoreductase [Virgibacillus halophilus]|uniref:Gfo/Idh/MocA family oxidoreductase n=1 Tax=Tigheibacillus halophilus TaxID=361280 RepID=A0ABU5C466_9BACI|nr:Gfo/Idh/MocA family oxidoreductase [Virgibacillus halophilus]
MAQQKLPKKELLPAFSRAENATVTAIASRTKNQKAEEIAQHFDIEKVYDSYEALLDDEEIDAVYIPLPNNLHKEWVIKAAEKGKHILCEKPAALHAEEMAEMQTACEKHNVQFVEAFMYRFHPQHERVKEIIDSGEIGKVRFMRASFSFLLESKTGSIKMNPQGGGSIYDVGCYGIHATRNILRMEPESVFVQGIMDTKHHVDTAATGIMTFPDHVQAVFDASFSMARRAEYEVIGEKGRVVVPRAFRPDWFEGQGIVDIETESGTRRETIVADQYKAEVEYASKRVLENGGKGDMHFRDAINNLRVITACLKSLRENKTIQLN